MQHGQRYLWRNSLYVYPLFLSHDSSILQFGNVTNISYVAEPTWDPVSHANAGSVFNLPIGGLRSEFSNEVQSTRRERGYSSRDRLLAYLWRGFHCSHRNCQSNKGFRIEGSTSVFLQFETLRLCRIRGCRVDRYCGIL